MGKSGASGPEEPGHGERWTPAPLGDVLARAAERFGQVGSLGLLVVDASALEEVEASYGRDAYLGALRALCDLVRGVADEALEEDFWVSLGETGRSEVVLLMPHGIEDGRFYRRDLPALARDVRDRLVRHGQRIVYPYLRRPPRLATGLGFELRNPRLALVTQLRNALDEARSDARLNARHAARDRRQQLLQVITSGRIKAVYEPIVDATELTVFGYEALARGPVGSTLASPAELFPAAEEENLGFALDCLCRQKAIEGAVDFPEGVKLFMNIRPSAIHDPSFQPDELKRTLDRCGLSPSDVVFEISEQESIENYEVLREKRDEYGKLGFQFALDDTGAGYACLEAVLELCPDYIKIDRAFVSGIDEDNVRQTMVQAFKAMADGVGACIIGEGLDRLEELQTLVSLGIPYGQGWLFGKPTPLLPGPPLLDELS